MASNECIVFCDNPSNKHGKKHPYPVVQRFVYREGSENELGLGWTDQNNSKRLKVAQAHVDASQALIGDEKFSYRNPDHRGKQHRESWVFQCKKCGYEVAVRHENLYPTLTRMRELGVSRIGLIALQKGLKLAP